MWPGYIKPKLKAKYRDVPLADLPRARQIWSSYRITWVQYESIYKSQEGKCAICFQEIGFHSFDKNLANVDHSHVTGKVRGLLCDQCNYGLGNFKDDTRSLEQAIKYLSKF